MLVPCKVVFSAITLAGHQVLESCLLRRSPIHGTSPVAGAHRLVPVSARSQAAQTSRTGVNYKAISCSMASPDVPRTRENSITKTSAKEVWVLCIGVKAQGNNCAYQRERGFCPSLLQGFCLSDKDLEPLSVVHKPNPRSPRSGAPMSLYLQTEVGST